MGSGKLPPPHAKVTTVPCDICGRSFATDRIDTHRSICAKQKPRKIFDISKQRIEGTDAADLVKAGQLKLDKPRPNEKKSALTEKMKGTRDAKAPLPPITEGKQDNNNKRNNGTAYHVVFDANDKMKTKKNTKFPTGVPLAPLNNGKKRAKENNRDVDARYLSAERARGNWKSAATRVRPGLSASMTNGILDSDEEDDLAASMASQRTVCSDAFDFLFDSQNLNPERVLDQAEIEKYTEEKMRSDEPDNKNIVHQSSCCTIS